MTAPTPAGWYPDPENPAQQRYWDGAAWTQNVAPTSPSGPSPGDSASQLPQSVVDAPVLGTWKTSTGFSVLGLLLGVPLLMLLSTLVGILPAFLFAMMGGGSSPQVAGRIFAVVGNGLMLIYALAVYPSYFSEKPRLRSSKAISFSNFVFGGLIFGLLWNGNLSKRTKGSSYIVAAVLSGLMCLSLASSIVVALVFGTPSTPANTPRGPSSVEIPTPVPKVPEPALAAPSESRSVKPLERTKGVNIFTDGETGTSFVIPSAWTELPLREPGRTLDARFEVVRDSAYAMYGSVDLWSLLSEDNKRDKTRADFQDMADLADGAVLGLGSGTPNTTVRRMVLNEVEYLATSSSLSSDGQELRQVMLLRLEKGCLYSFQYTATPAAFSGGLDDPSLQTFYSMVASTVYPKD